MRKKGLRKHHIFLGIEVLSVLFFEKKEYIERIGFEEIP